LKERGSGYANRFRRTFEPEQIEETINSAIISRHSRPARTYTEKKDDNEFRYTPQPPPRGGKRKTKKRSKKSKTSKSI
jgi:hypothetical protein